MESRILGDKYVRFGGEYLETYHRNMTRRWVLTLLGIWRYSVSQHSERGTF
ncbi:relaxase domain protein [Bacillus cereus]|nr:relaxase domain protein [Bacillus cereus]